MNAGMLLHSGLFLIQVFGVAEVTVNVPVDTCGRKTIPCSLIGPVAGVPEVVFVRVTTLVKYVAVQLLPLAFSGMHQTS